MKQGIFAFSMVVLLFISVIPLGIGTGIDDSLLNSMVKETDQTDISEKPCKSGSILGDTPPAKQVSDLMTTTETSTAEGKEWNLNYTDDWRDFAYAEGNKTRLIVGLDGEASNSLHRFEEIVTEYQAEIVNEVSIKGEVIAVVVEIYFDSVTSLIEEIHNANLASYLEPNMKFQAQMVPNDPYWHLQWGPEKIGADCAWNTTVGDSSVLVAVVDTGIDYTHPDIAANYVALGYDWANDDPYPIDDFGHGTHCAGIIAAVLNNGLGIAGIANVSIMAEKVLDEWGDGYADWVANGIINAADSGADVISMSIGSYGWGELLRTAVNYAYDSGVLMVAAAGNEETNMKLYPAGYDEVVAVSATDQYDNTAWWSNWGDWIELAAPGVDIYSTMPTYYVTMNDIGYSQNYDYASGTSMACPHVAGVAALAWSQYPNRTRDWMRRWLQLKADDLGAEGFDIYFGHGRVNARRAVEETPPAHELIAYEWETPTYVEPGDTGRINATILNFGENDETDVNVHLLANDTIVDTTSIGFFASGNSTTTSLTWNPTAEGLYNITLYVVPVPDEEDTENNALSKNIYVGTPVKAVVLRSSGNLYSEIITNWQVLNTEWPLFGDTMVQIDYTTLNKEDITYEDIADTEADVLIISCAYNWEFTDSEIEAIGRYAHEGHGLIATAGTLYQGVPNNNKLAPLFGLDETVMWEVTGTDLMHLVNTPHPIFTRVPNPLIFPAVQTALPYDVRWDSNELTGGEYLAIGHYEESSIVAFRGLLYLSPWLEIIPPHYHHHLQLIYNSITWSTYQRSQHELTVFLETEERLEPGEQSWINATVSNLGQNNETNVELKLFIDESQVDNATIPELLVDSSYTLSFQWTPPSQGTYNITAYAPPILEEEFTDDNKIQKRVVVLTIAVSDVLVYSDDYPMSPSSRYVIVALDSLGINYTHFSDDPSGFGSALISQPWDLVIVDHCNYYSIGNYWTELEEYVHNGGLLILSTFDVDGSDSEPTTLWSTLGVHWTSDMLYPEPVYRWAPSHPLFTFPNTVEDLSLYTEEYYDDGDHVTATTGTPVAGFSPSITEGFSAIVIGNAYPTILFSFILDEFRNDEDNDGTLDTIELWENAIAYLARAYEHDLAVALDAPGLLEPGESTVLNATIWNRGINNETNVELRLLFNGSTVDSVLIPELNTHESYTHTYVWNPITEGVYNLTAYAPPMPGEDLVFNNVAVRISKVRPIKGWILFDQTHITDSIEYCSFWVANLVERGYGVGTHTSGPITSAVLQDYDVFVIPQAEYVYSTDELSVIQNFVLSGGGLLVIGDDEPWIYTGLTSFAGMTWASGGCGGDTSDITPHPVTEGVTTALFAAPIGVIYTEPPALDLVRDPCGNTMLAASEIGGRVVCIGDEDSIYDGYIGYVDNLRLANNIIDWLIPPEHDVSVTVDVPTYIELGTSVLVGATVWNTGLNNETDVELRLLIDGEVVNGTTIDELPKGCYFAISFLWTPINTGEHNVTAYALPLPEEEYVINNLVTKEIGVFYYARFYLTPRWVGAGTPMAWHGDDSSWEYTLPFDFPFYGIYYRTIYVSSNGLITFTGPDTSYVDSVSALAERLAIAPAWDDWVTYSPHDIYVWENSTHIGIGWYVAAYYDNSITANFEVILNAEGIIQLNYASNNGPISATIGISNGMGHIIAETVWNTDYINTIIFSSFQRDVAIYGVTASPSQVQAGETVNINVTVANEGEMHENVEVRVYYENATEYSGSAGFVLSIPTEPHSANAMWIEPAFKDLTDYDVGDRFNVTAWLNLTEISYVWQIMLLFEPTYLYAARAGYTAGSTSEFFAGHTTVPVTPIIDNASGYVMYGETLLVDSREPGYGSLCWIEFEVVSKPSEPYEGHLHFDPSRTYVLDPDLWDLTITLYDAAYGFLVSPPPPPPSPLIGKETVYLPSKSNETLAFLWNTTGVRLGNYTLRAVAVPVEGEMDIDDNTFVDGTVEILSINDVALARILPATTWVYQGQTMAFNVTVENRGDVNENVTVTLYYNITGSSLIGTGTITDLLPGENSTITLLWDTTGVTPCRNYTITAVATIEAIDSNPTDNILEDGDVKIRFVGDLNGDDKVDMRDVGVEARAFGSFPGHPRWNPDYDLNGDDMINMRDVALVVKNFGSCS